MPVNAQADAAVAAALATLPPFQQWADRPLDAHLQDTLRDEADTQTLMTLAAHALQRVAAQTTPDRE